MCIRDRFYPEHNRRRSAHPQTLVAMYCDKDNREHYAIMDLDKELLETIRRALTMYRCGLYAVSYTHLDVYKRQAPVLFGLLDHPERNAVFDAARGVETFEFRIDRCV